MNNSSSSKKQNNRRDFLKYLLTGGILGFASVVIYPLIAYLKPPKQREVEVSSVKAGKLSEIEKNSGRIIRFGNKPVILVRTAAGDLRADPGLRRHHQRLAAPPGRARGRQGGRGVKGQGS